MNETYRNATENILPKTKKKSREKQHKHCTKIRLEWSRKFNETPVLRLVLKYFNSNSNRQPALIALWYGSGSSHSATSSWSYKSTRWKKKEKKVPPKAIAEKSTETIEEWEGRERNRTKHSIRWIGARCCSMVAFRAVVSLRSKASSGKALQKKREN